MKQIPFGNDSKKSKGNDKGKRRSFDFVPFGHCAQDDSVQGRGLDL